MRTPTFTFAIIAGLLGCAAQPPDIAPPKTEELTASLDTDGDGIPDTDDLCPFAFDPLQSDEDFNGVGDNCEERLSPGCNLDGICWEFPHAPPAHSSMAAAHGEELWIASLGLHHWDGKQWSVTPSPFSPAPKVFVALPNALWAIDGTPRKLWRRQGEGAWEIVTLPDGREPERLWAADDTRVWVDSKATLVLTDGATTFLTATPAPWTQTSGAEASLGFVSVEGPASVWSLADKLRHYNGHGWKDVARAPFPTGKATHLVVDGGVAWVRWQHDEGGLSLYRLGASGWESMPWPGGAAGELFNSPAGVWVDHGVGQQHWDGATWHPRGTRLPGMLTEVPGNDGRWRLTREGGIWLLQGDEWTPLRLPIPKPWTLALRGDETWVAGDDGFTAKRVDGRWQRVKTPTLEHLRHLTGRGDELWAASDHYDVLRLVDGAWEKQPGRFDSVRGIWIGEENVVVNAQPSRRFFLPTQSWEDGTLWGVGLAIGGDTEDSLFAVTNRGSPESMLLRRSGQSTWDTVYETSILLRDVDAQRGEAWAVGRGGVVHLGFSGASREWPWPHTSQPTWVRMGAPGEAWVGDGMSVFRTDPSGFTFAGADCKAFVVETRECLGSEGVRPLEPTPVDLPLMRLGNTIARFDGRTWRPLREGAGAWTDGHKALVLSWNGQLWSYEAGAWTLNAELPADFFWGNVWSDGDEHFVSASLPLSRDRVVLRVRNGQWDEVWRGAVFTLAGTGMDDLFLSTVGGMLRWDGAKFVAEDFTSPADQRWTGLSSTGQKGKLWAFGGTALAFRDGLKWSDVPLPDGATHVRDVWSDGADTWLSGMMQPGDWATWRKEGDDPWRLVGATRGGYLGGTTASGERQVFESPPLERSIWRLPQ